MQDASAESCGYGHQLRLCATQLDSACSGLNLRMMCAQVKISDFGSARFCEYSDTIFATAGTPAFMSPEMCAGGLPGLLPLRHPV